MIVVVQIHACMSCRSQYFWKNTSRSKKGEDKGIVRRLSDSRDNGTKVIPQTSCLGYIVLGETAVDDPEVGAVYVHPFATAPRLFLLSSRSSIILCDRRSRHSALRQSPCIPSY